MYDTSQASKGTRKYKMIVNYKTYHDISVSFSTILHYSSNNLGIVVQSSKTFQNHYWPINLMSGLASRPRPSTSRKTMNVTNAYWFRLWTSNLNINWLLLAYTGVPATWSDMSQVGELRWLILNDGACMMRMWPPKKASHWLCRKCVSAMPRFFTTFERPLISSSRWK